ncbi:MAG: FAD:protein FMN transferase [Burkholderiaceae bacterium]
MPEGTAPDAHEALDALGAGAWRGRFKAMASPCELLVEGAGEAQARALLDAAAAEAQRIEAKFSRYRDDSVIAMLHRSRGQAVTVDDETALLLDYAATCHALSGGLFDVTSGVLREAWRFDGSDRLPSAAQVAALVARIGWHRVHWQRPRIMLPAGMEIDLGGIGKEYAVDRTLAVLQAMAALPMLVNFGGDLAVSGPRADGSAWQVGVERPDMREPSAVMQLELRSGALATSGDARRYLINDGVRYGHILDPRDGWPVRGAPRSITVAAGHCTEAGTLATLAMLQGPQAEAWLARQGVPHWVIR